MLQKSRNMQLPARVGYGERYRLRRLTGGPMRGCLLSHAISSVSSTPGVASGVTRRSGKPWFFANRFIESSLSPKSLAITRNCSHRSVQVVIRTFHPSHVYIPSRQAPLRSPQADPQWTWDGSCLVLRISLDSKNQLEISHGKA